MTTGGARPPKDPVNQLYGTALWAKVASAARCAKSGRSPDDWFPVSPDVSGARAEAAEAIEICAICPVRQYCLDLSLRNWTLGQHGIWGGLVAAEREALRRQRRRNLIADANRVTS